MITELLARAATIPQESAGATVEACGLASDQEAQAGALGLSGRASP